MSWLALAQHISQGRVFGALPASCRRLGDDPLDIVERRAKTPFFFDPVSFQNDEHAGAGEDYVPRILVVVVSIAGQHKLDQPITPRFSCQEAERLYALADNVGLIVIEVPGQEVSAERPLLWTEAIWYEVGALPIVVGIENPVAHQLRRFLGEPAEQRSDGNDGDRIKPRKPTDDVLDNGRAQLCKASDRRQTHHRIAVK